MTFWTGELKTYWCLRWGWSQTYWSGAGVWAGSGSWWETNYGRVIWTNRMWVCALRSAPPRTEWWSVRRPDDPSPRRRTPPLITPLRKCFSCCVPQSFLTFITPFVSPPKSRPLSPLFVLPLTPLVAELLMGCWACEISPAADLFAGAGCVLSSLSTVTLHRRACVCTPPTWVRISVWLIKSPDDLLKELFKSARVLVSKPRLDFQDVRAACGENNTRSPCTHCHVQCWFFYIQVMQG